MRFVIVIAIPIALLIIYKIAQSVTPDKPIEYTIIASLFGLVAWLGRMVFTLKADEGSLKSQIDSLKEEKSELKQKVSGVEQENITLQENISEKTHRENLLSQYPPDSSSAIRREKTTGRAVCNICIQQENSIISYLEKLPNSWYCRNCEKSFK